MWLGDIRGRIVQTESPLLAQLPRSACIRNPAPTEAADGLQGELMFGVTASGLEHPQII
jgi:hypothetical protein